MKSFSSCFLLFYFIFSPLTAQITFKIDDFSDRFYATVEFQPPDFRIRDNYGWISVIDKEKQDTLFRQAVSHISRENWKLSPAGEDNFQPYNEQDLIFYEDFNFDGIKDFSIAAWTRDPNNWYNYKVYLGNEKGEFIYNKTLSEITNGQHGMFTTDKNSNEYTVHVNSSEYETYKKVYQIVNDEPVLVRGYSKTKQGRNNLLIEESTFYRKNAKDSLQFQTESYLNSKNRTSDTLLYFSIPKKQRKALVLSHYDQLNYVLIRPDNSIEHHHQEDFYHKANSDLPVNFSFQNGIYSLSETEKEIGIEINIDGEKYYWNGDKTTQKGSLKTIFKNSYKNKYVIRQIEIPDSPYYGEVLIKDKADDQGFVSGPGWIKISEKKSKKELINVESDMLFLQLNNGALTNDKPLSYDNQDILIYKDFNFDGKKDLALSDGNFSCYGGPSYQIYLADKNKFSFDESFTELAQDYCGMFQINTKEQTLETMVKSGCCWHQFSTFSVKDNQPYLTKRIEEDAATSSPFTVNYTIEKRKNGKMQKEFIQKLITDDLQMEEGSFNPRIYNYFEFENGKRMYFITDYDHNEIYAFTNSEHEIELISTGPFSKHDNERFVQFQNDNVIYRIFYDHLEVIIDGETHILTPKIRKNTNTEYFNAY